MSYNITSWIMDWYFDDFWKVMWHFSHFFFEQNSQPVQETPSPGSPCRPRQSSFRTLSKDFEACSRANRFPWRPEEVVGFIFYIIQWIGLRENLQETMVFTIKYRVFRLKFSHHPILWIMVIHHDHLWMVYLLNGWFTLRTLWKWNMAIEKPPYLYWLVVQ